MGPKDFCNALEPFPTQRPARRNNNRRSKPRASKNVDEQQEGTSSYRYDGN